MPEPTNGYITLAELRSWMGYEAANTGDDTMLVAAIEGACRGIDRHTGRTFVVAGATATARVFPAMRVGSVAVSDVSTPTGLIVEVGTSASGPWSTVSDAYLTPLDAEYAHVEPFPYTRVNGPIAYPFVRVTARWGWQARPQGVREATKMLAARMFKRKNSPQGVAMFGEFAVSIAKTDPDVAALLADYIRADRAKGIG